MSSPSILQLPLRTRQQQQEQQQQQLTSMINILLTSHSIAKALSSPVSTSASAALLSSPLTPTTTAHNHSTCRSRTIIWILTSIGKLHQHIHTLHLAKHSPYISAQKDSTTQASHPRDH
jgi:hypothetical protein